MIYVIDHLLSFFARAEKDQRLLPSHISLFTAVLMTVPANKLTLPVKVIRKDLMRLAHINSIATYHKCIKELVNYGYIAYTPSFNYYQGCLISLK